MFLQIILFLTKQISNTYTNQNTYNNQNTFFNQYSTFLHKQRNSYGGYDERYSNHTSFNHTEFFKIKQYFDKKKLLNLLQDEKISLYSKISLLKMNSITACNICAGGLLKDFEFEDF